MKLKNLSGRGQNKSPFKSDEDSPMNVSRSPSPLLEENLRTEHDIKIKKLKNNQVDCRELLANYD